MANNRYERPRTLPGTCGPCTAGSREQRVRKRGLEAGARTTRRSRWGVGPPIGLITAAWAGLALIIHWATYPAFAIPDGWRPAFRACGLGLLGMGVPAYAVLAIYFAHCSKRAALIQTGPYARVRHPLYAVWVFFLVPGAALLAGSWLLLSVPPVMYLAARVFIPREEAELEDRYGELYREYRLRTGRLLPKFRGRKPRGKPDAS